MLKCHLLMISTYPVSLYFIYTFPFAIKTFLKRRKYILYEIIISVLHLNNNYIHFRLSKKNKALLKN